MRFTKKTPSKKDSDIKVFNFSLGLTELLLLHSLIEKTLSTIPYHFEMRPSIMRLKDMSRSISETLNKERIDVKEIKSKIRDVINEMDQKLIKGGYRKKLE